MNLTESVVHGIVNGYYVVVNCIEYLRIVVIPDSPAVNLRRIDAVGWPVGTRRWRRRCGTLRCTGRCGRRRGRRSRTGIRVLAVTKSHLIICIIAGIIGAVTLELVPGCVIHHIASPIKTCKALCAIVDTVGGLFARLVSVLRTSTRNEHQRLTIRQGHVTIRTLEKPHLGVTSMAYFTGSLVGTDLDGILRGLRALWQIWILSTRNGIRFGLSVTYKVILLEGKEIIICTTTLIKCLDNPTECDMSSTTRIKFMGATIRTWATY